MVGRLPLRRRRSPSPPVPFAVYLQRFLALHSPRNQVGRATPSLPEPEKFHAVVRGSPSVTNLEDPFTRSPVVYKIIRVVSPSEFYVVKVENPEHKYLLGSRERALFKMRTELTINEDYAKRHGITYDVRPSKYKIYGYFDKVTQQWQRVRLVDYDQNTGFALLYLYDIQMRMEFAKLSELRQVEFEWSTAGIHPVYRCHLYDVIPPSGDNVWSQDALEWFRVTTNRHSVWTGVMMSMNRKLVYGGDDPIYDLGLVLFSDGRRVNESLNYRMVNSGLGRAIGIGGNGPYLPFVQELMPKYNGVVPIWLQEEVLDDPMSRIPRNAGFYMGRLSLALVEGPDLIYFHDMSKLAELRAMELALYRQNIENPIPLGLRVMMYTPVSIMLKDPETGRDKYYRGIVTKFLANACQVLLVDYGNRIKTKLGNLKFMPLEFSTIPSYAHRVHLKNIQPHFSSQLNYIWPQHLRNRFSGKLGLIHTDLRPEYYPLCSVAKVHNDSIILRELDQGIMFNGATQKWVAQPNPGNEIYEDLFGENGLSLQNPLTGAHLVSYGIDVVLVHFGQFGDDDELWDTEFLLDHFVEEEEDRRIFGMKYLDDGTRLEDKEEYYERMLMMYDRSWERFRQVVCDERRAEIEAIEWRNNSYSPETQQLHGPVYECHP